MNVKEKKIETILNNEFVRGAIDEAVENHTGHHKVIDPFVKKILTDYAAKAATKMLDGTIPFPDFINEINWKKKIAVASWQLLNVEEFIKTQIPIIAEYLAPKFGNITKSLTNGFWMFSLAKIAQTTGLVTYMIANELDPELLRLSREEANEDLQKLAQKLASRDPKSVTVVNL